MSIVMSVLIGVPSGYFGGWFDTAVQRFVDARMAIPGLIILIIVMSLVGPGTLQVIVIQGSYSGIQNSRVIRSAVIGIKESTYILAAVAIGCQPSRILLNHILVNIVPPIIIVFSTTIGWVILAEAFLSFLG